MTRIAVQNSMMAALVALSLSCSNSGANDSPSQTTGSGGTIATGSGGAIATGSGGTAMVAAGGSGGMHTGSGGTTMQPVAGHPATGGSMATMPVVDGGGTVPGVDGGLMPSGGKLLPVTGFDDMGPYAVTIEMNVGPSMDWVAHPTDLGKNGELHPIFSWGCGGGSEPSQYMDHMTRIASYGIVMASHVSNGDGSEHKATIDWLIEQNGKSDSPYYQKLDITKIAAGGHSIGSIATFAFQGMDDRITTSIHVAGGSFDGMGYMMLKNPTLMVDGDGDTLALSNTQADYAASTVPTFLTVITGSDHIYAARDGLPPIVAWLRWWLGGETERKSMFIGADCDFCKGKYNGMSKNW